MNSTQFSIYFDFTLISMTVLLCFASFWMKNNQMRLIAYPCFAFRKSLLLRIETFLWFPVLFWQKLQNELFSLAYSISMLTQGLQLFVTLNLSYCQPQKWQCLQLRTFWAISPMLSLFRKIMLRSPGKLQWLLRLLDNKLALSHEISIGLQYPWLFYKIGTQMFNVILF